MSNLDKIEKIHRSIGDLLKGAYTRDELQLIRKMLEHSLAATGSQDG